MALPFMGFSFLDSLDRNEFLIQGLRIAVNVLE